MTEQEVKQNLIDRYIDLLRIKAVQKEVNEELEFQLAVAKVKLSSYNIDIESLEKMIPKKN